MARLRIYDRRERALVRLADTLLWPISMARRVPTLRRVFDGAHGAAPRRILCLRLERIGDLLMTLPALAELRTLAPDAEIDLVVGSWNRDIAGAIPGITRVEMADAAWLTRDGKGSATAPLLARAATWRSRKYDLAINFEPDIRSNLTLGAVRAMRAAGFVSGGGGAVLDVRLDYDATSHTEDNALALVRAALGASSGTTPMPVLAIPDQSRAEAERRLAVLPDGRRIGLHVSGGRAIKQWPDSRFRDVAEHVVRTRDASIVLTGAPGDRAQVEVVRSALPADRVLDLSEGTNLLTTAAIVQQLDLFVTGDTGPMHLARAVGTPIVAVFGPSDPRRYGPRGVRDVIVRIDLPCSPCNRIRLPPARCTGHTPDCLNGVATAQVLAAIDEALEGRA
jgi:ADP-heptose:LPS heptosyltransferase